jgi:peptide chain release factor 1
VKSYFDNESGSHCFVRIPPTEKAGRVQTSFVTVALMYDDVQNEFKLNKSDVIKSYIRSSKKAGGQNLNKVSSCVQLTHIPTGIQLKVQDTRDQYKNEIIAWERLYQKLKSIDDNINYEKNKLFRNEQIGNGSRGGTKRRTYRIREDMVQDHITGKSCRWKDILRGKIELLS